MKLVPKYNDGIVVSDEETQRDNTPNDPSNEADKDVSIMSVEVKKKVLLPDLQKLRMKLLLQKFLW